MSLEKATKWKKIIPLIVLGVGFFMVARSIFSLNDLFQRRNTLFVQQQNLHKLEEEQLKLKQQLSKTYTLDFLEKEAREKLGLVKNGEIVVYLENNNPSFPNKEDKTKEFDSANKSILLQWIEIFF